MSGRNFRNKVEKTIHVPSLSKSGAVRHLRKSDISADFKFRKDFGDVSVMCENHFQKGQDGREKGYIVEVVGNHNQDGKENNMWMYTCASSTGTIEECSDKIIQQLSESIGKLDRFRNELQQAVDYLASSMLGNEEMVRRSEKYEECSKDMDEIATVLFTEDEENGQEGQA